MTPVGVFFCWQGGAERDFVNSTSINHDFSLMQIPGIGHKAIDLRATDGRLRLCQLDGRSSPVWHIPHNATQHIGGMELLHITVHVQAFPTQDLRHRVAIHLDAANNRHITHLLPYELHSRSNTSDQRT